MDGLLRSLEGAKRRSGGQLMSLDAITAVDNARQKDEVRAVKHALESKLFSYVAYVCAVNSPTRIFCTLLRLRSSCSSQR